jgi:PAS domain S-box-containing protein
MNSRKNFSNELAAENSRLKVEITVLRVIEKRFRAVLYGIGDAVIITDIYGNIQQMNHIAEDLTGWKEIEARGKTVGEVFHIINENTRTKIDCPVRQVICINAVADLGNDVLLIARNGAGHPIDGKAALIQEEAGKTDGVILIFRDITQRKKIIDELKKQKEYLEEAYKELDTFSYSVSHDLKAPLRAMAGFSKIILKDYAGKLDAGGKRNLNIICSNAKRMKDLIDDLLRFSHLQRQQMSFTDINMKELVESVVSEVKDSMAAGREIKLEIRNVPSAKGDPHMMRQVWLNLISNAVKFTSPKSIAYIEIGEIGADNELIYYVKDNGAGFDMQYVDRLFGVFQRLHGESEFEGTGVGLAIVQRIIHKHGGRAWAEGKVNEGATFYFTLPIK